MIMLNIIVYIFYLIYYILVLLSAEATFSQQNGENSSVTVMLFYCVIERETPMFKIW